MLTMPPLPKTSDDDRTHQGLMITRGEKRAIKKAADARGISLNAMMRLALQAHFGPAYWEEAE